MYACVYTYVDTHTHTYMYETENKRIKVFLTLISPSLTLHSQMIAPLPPWRMIGGLFPGKYKPFILGWYTTAVESKD